MASKNTSSSTSSKTNPNKTASKLTAYQKEQIETLKKINEFKEACEANIVAILYKEPDLIRENNIELTEFTNNCWRVYFEIAKEIIITERKNVLDEVTVGLFLSKHPKLSQKYDEYGGYQIIENAGAYVKIENFYGYLDEMRKWNAVIKLNGRGFGVVDRLKDFCDMTAEDIYKEYEVYLNDIFINANSDVTSYDISDGIYDLIEELDKGLAVGLPYDGMPLLTKETGGQYFGSITLVGGLSNVGKSTFARTSTIPSIIKNKERIVIMLNEDGIAKWQRELLVYVANNVQKFNLQKHVVRDGKYTSEVKKALYAAADWLVEQTKNHVITVIPFKKYQTSQVIKIIKKYSAMGCKYFLLDTYKMDAGKVSNNSWLEMQQNMVEINDAIKPETNNVHILITFQLAKGSINQRYYTQDNIGVAKNIIDPASTCIMIRDLYDDEYPGEKRELKVYKYEPNYGKMTKIPQTLSKDKRYQILFIVKNREGAANSYQIVIEHDMSRNTMKEIGICNVPIDF